MPETAQSRVPTAEAYFATSHVLATGSASTPVLYVWRTLNLYMVDHRLPMTGQQLSEASGLSLEEVEHLFSQVYYQRWYGFRRYDTLAEWQQFADHNGLLYDPAKHGVQTEPDEPEVEETGDEPEAE